jgi:hypothetical protein
MSDESKSQRDDVVGETESSPDNVIDLEVALDQRDRDIAQLKESLNNEQRLAKTLRHRIGRIDHQIGDLGDGLIDRLGTCRDLQSVLAEQKTIEQESNAEHDLTSLQNQSNDRSLLLRDYQKKIDELTYQRDRLHDQLAEADRLAADPDFRGESRATRPPERRDLYSLEELMAETVVLTEEDREQVGLDLEETAIQRREMEIPGDMVSPEAMMNLQDREAPAEASDDGRLGTLLVTLQGGHQFRYPIFDRAIMIGRAGKNDIQINNEFVSRVHARISMSDTGPVIQDVSSMNGILVDAVPVKRYTFRSGDVVALGTTLLTYQANEPA